MALQTSININIMTIQNKAKYFNEIRPAQWTGVRKLQVLARIMLNFVTATIPITWTNSNRVFRVYPANALF